MNLKWLKRGLILLLVGGFAGVMFKPFCNMLFHCGCQALWAAAGRFCNVHTAGVPHCPLCSTGMWGAYLPLGLIWTAQAGVVLAPSRLSAIHRLVLGVLAFIIVGLTVGFFFRWWTHYPVFLGI